MKRWQAYRDDLLFGDWQVHSTWSDGRSSILEYCEKALSLGLRLIAFTEHVRKELKYDFAAYVHDVETARRLYPDLKILHGCEAKVLNPEGELDVSPAVLEQCDIVLGAVHSFGSPERYLEAVESMLCNPCVDIWAHPTLYAQRHGIVLTDCDEERLVRVCLDRHVLVEFNGKYGLPGPSFRKTAKALGAPFVYGSDAHCAEELGYRLGEVGVA